MLGRRAHEQETAYCRRMGGWSPEREISLISGEKCAEALRALGHQVTRLM